MTVSPHIRAKDPVGRAVQQALLWWLLSVAAGWAGAVEYDWPQGDLVGVPGELQLSREDTLAAIAQRLRLGYLELLQANPEVDPWLPEDGARLLLPTWHVLPPAARQGIVVNLAEYRLYAYDTEQRRVMTYPIGIGREGFATPLMQARIISRAADPSWTPPESIRAEHRARGDILPRVVPAGPDNPLGVLALKLDAPGYLLHGTNKPFGVGQAVSHGCIRLYNPDILQLAGHSPNGTSVRVIDAPYKAGWHEGMLYLEAHPPQTVAAGEYDHRALMQALIAATPEGLPPLDWAAVESAARLATGVPTPISLPD